MSAPDPRALVNIDGSVPGEKMKLRRGWMGTGMVALN
jgi:hypothetical protein